MQTIKVYATCFWEDDEKLLETLKLFNGGSAIWKNIELTLKPDFDVAIVFTAPYPLHKDYENRPSVTFLTEPPASSHHRRTTDIISGMYLPMPWWIKSPAYLRPGRPKRRLISAVTSDLYSLEGHVKRLNFLYYFDKTVEGNLDIFGYKRERVHILDSMVHYRGELADKYMGLLPYQYHFACENSFVPNYFTEKILDPILCGCLCFYDGCPNVEEFIDKRSFIRLDINDLEQSLDRIVSAVDSQEYKKRRKYILSEKRRLMSELNPLNIIWAQINDKLLPDYFKL